MKSHAAFSLYVLGLKSQAIFRDKLAGVYPQAIFCMGLIREHDTLTMTDLASHMQMNSSATSTLVSRLEKKGFVRRTHSLEDRRVVNVSMTGEGVFYLVDNEQAITEAFDDVEDLFTARTASEMASTCEDSGEQL